MSYVRFSDESDVYVYQNAEGLIICCGCRLVEGRSVYRKIEEGMVTHLESHRSRGNKVPDSAIVNLSKSYASSFDPRFFGKEGE